MRFELLTNKGSYTYDNITNELFPVPDFSLAREFVKPIRQREIQKPDFGDRLHKELPITHLRIQVGLNCNCRCSYCIQNQYRASKDNVPLKDIQFLIDSVVKYLSPRCHIEFWGGEPLMYRAELEYLIPKLRDTFPRCKLSLITNGLLLTEKYIKLFEDNKVAISVSHDGPAYFLRNTEDPLLNPKLKDLWILANERLDFSLNTVISQYNCDLYELDEWFATYAPNIRYQYEGVVITHSNDALPYVAWNNERKSVLYDCIYKAIASGENSRVFDALAHRVRHVLRFITYGLRTDLISAKCDALKPNVLSIDLNGNILSCHNVNKDQIVGNVADIGDRFTIRSKFKHWSLRSKCKDCYALLSCRGNCARNNDLMHELGCEIQYVFHKAIMDGCISMLTNEVIKECYNED